MLNASMDLTHYITHSYRLSEATTDHLIVNPWHKSYSAWLVCVTVHYCQMLYMTLTVARDCHPLTHSESNIKRALEEDWGSACQKDFLRSGCKASGILREVNNRKSRCFTFYQEYLPTLIVQEFPRHVFLTIHFYYILQGRLLNITTDKNLFPFHLATDVQVEESDTNFSYL